MPWELWVSQATKVLSMYLRHRIHPAEPVGILGLGLVANAVANEFEEKVSIGFERRISLLAAVFIFGYAL
jgi:hypothetical protein